MTDSGMIKKITEPMITLRPFAGICHMQVCAHKDCTEEEIVRFCNQDNPSGTSLGWTRIDREGSSAPVVCANDPDRFHYMISC